MPIQDKEISDKILNAFFAVYNGLGYGFLEKVYENAMVYAMRQRGLQVEQQRRISVYFDGVMVGDYFADILVENRIIVELKAAESIAESHIAQLMNYLKATPCEVGFVLNFGPQASFKRLLFSNFKKKNLKISVESAESV
jgi:GxxExxY protein